MDLLIKGLEMPRKGCSHTIYLYADGKVVTGGREYMAVPVPPHGRLIDADRLKEDYPRHMTQDVPYFTEMTVEDCIDESPTILEASE